MSWGGDDCFERDEENDLHIKYKNNNGIYWHNHTGGPTIRFSWWSYHDHIHQFTKDLMKYWISRRRDVPAYYTGKSLGITWYWMRQRSSIDIGNRRSRCGRGWWWCGRWSWPGSNVCGGLNRGCILLRNRRGGRRGWWLSGGWYMSDQGDKIRRNTI